MSIEVEVVLDEDDVFIAADGELMVLLYWWFSIVCWFVMGRIVPRLWGFVLSTVSESLAFCCCDWFIFSLSRINNWLIPLLVAICWYKLLLCMGILCLEDCEHMVELYSLLWDMGWNNISGWEGYVRDWWEQSLNVKEEEILESLEWSEADEYEWFLWYSALVGGIMVDGLYRGL